MNSLSTSIEAYLTEGGFNPTEIMVLRKLLEGSALTLRELASKTGKSTGVLDQATRKLITKGIVSRGIINDTTKYSVGSLEAIQAWMKDDMEKKHKELHRKEQDFESFISALKVDQARPEMEYFEGQEGITKAYGKLLTLAQKELLFYVPVSCREEDDPLRDFRVQHFRARHKRDLFSRVLAPQTHLGKRYQSRDPFEYRKTVLVPEAQFPVSFEKVIADDTIACFNHEDQSACFLRYPELAQSERAMFEMMWEREAENGKRETENVEEEKDKVSLSTVTMSAIRDFFISRKSIAAFIACAILAVGVTYGLYRQNVYLNTQRVRERVMAIAATAAPEFDAGDLNELHTWRDAEKPVYAKVVRQLQDVRERNEGVVYVYIMRPTDPPYFYEYVADADTLDIHSPEDLNNNGLRDDMLAPGYLYFENPYVPGFLLLQEAMDHPTADREPYTDIWGTWIGGYVPIRGNNGATVAILGVDIAAKTVKELSGETFNFLLYFLGFFLLFVFIRLAAFNRSLCKELLELIDTKEVMILLGSSALLALLITFGTYKYSYHLNLQRVRERVMAIAATAAPEFEAGDLDELHTWKDSEKPVYVKVVKQLQDVRERNEGVVYAYIMRPTNDPYFNEFVADADSLDIYSQEDIDGDGIRDDTVAPGHMFFDYMYKKKGEESALKQAMSKPSADKEPFNDPWGTWISGSAPIVDKNGVAVASLGVDIDASEIMRLTRESFRFVLFFFGLFIIFVLVGLAVYSKKLRSDLLILINAKAVLITLGVCSLIALGVTYGMYRYTLGIMKDEIGQRLMSIAATAAPEIDAGDLEVLRIAKDMEREEYQRVFRKLNEIRARNISDDITYIYVLRPTEKQNIWEWVVDSDSNYNIPNDGIDFNGDGVIDAADEGVAPGVSYDATGQEFATKGLKGPIIEDFITDQWGMFITGFAPIRDQESKPVAVLGVDMELSDFYSLIREKFSPYLWFFSVFTVFILARSVFVLLKSRK